jgi:hypothetical protein
MLAPMLRNQRIEEARFASEVADGTVAEILENDRFASYAYECQAAADRLHAQFPDTPAAKWLTAIKAATGFGPDVQFTSAEKQAAFDAAIKKL